MKIAGNEVEQDDAVASIRTYAGRYPGTLEIFDGIGDNGYRDDSPDRVTLADIGRLVVINARLDADDVPQLLSVDAGAEFSAVPVEATLEGCAEGDSTWNAATALYSKFTGRSGIARAKRSKLLHAKRPGLFFISDSHTGKLYEESVKAIAKERGDGSAGYWAAAQQDIQQDEFGELMDEVSSIVVEGLSGRPTLAPLTRLRVLDIVAWSL